PTDYMKKVSRNVFYATAFVFLMLGAPARNGAQDPPPNPPDNPPAPTDKPKPAKPNTDTATQNSPNQPTWDPLRAEKDMQVGEYYMHKGDIDAAIDRFEDATLAKPGYALPFRFLGEAQEKKGMKKKAIQSYKRYLDLYPKAEDKDKIQKKIDKLYKDVEKERK
ncbi:MAG TPA: tetratricopeptide repeat protein, partial [Candidatus Acidoferrum sp.]